MGNVYQADFCVAPVGAANDLSVAAYPSLNNLRAGFDTHYRIVYRNMGTAPASGTISFAYENNRLNFLTASQTIAVQTPNTLSFDFADLAHWKIG
ncbi:hypothetical protein [Flavobacterium sp. 3HN19-14]|uniref:hypothetical protein n=1 Tax=Flavobacterium sp. 3HN19-14 TaxID=3448133 RepID=UPI003EDFF18B